MIGLRRTLACIVSALAALAAVGAFPSPAAAQPMQLPGAVPSAPAGTPVAPPAAAPRPGETPPRPAAAPVRQVAEDAVVGQALLHNGRSGRLVMERMRDGFGLRFTGEGFQTGNLTEGCGVSFGDQPVPLERVGRPAGLARFRLRAPACPIEFDVLSNAILVVQPQAPCVIEAAQCRIDVAGMWAPDGRGLTAMANEFARDRVAAENQVREGFRQLTGRAEGADRRDVAREQAGFSSEREQICRDFAREATHGFCAAKFTQARAASINARLNPPRAETAPARRN
jgi:hypothetical protein